MKIRESTGKCQKVRETKRKVKEKKQMLKSVVPKIVISDVALEIGPPIKAPSLA